MTKKIFSENPSLDNNAFLNWRFTEEDDIENFISMSNSFFDSSIFLLKLCLKDNIDSKADGLIFPILYNLNHAIELKLKALIRILNQSIGVNNIPKNTHNIKQLYHNSFELIKTTNFNISIKSFKENTKILYNYINEISENEMISFTRYPLSNKAEKAHYIISKQNITIDIKQLHEIATKIKDELNNFVDYNLFIQLTI